ncbi:MAG: hypothetical protein ACI8Z1_003315 [Candidatus Azotimanducaceae bacterium]|jgi:hypothetical protein
MSADRLDREPSTLYPVTGLIILVGAAIALVTLLTYGHFTLSLAVFWLFVLVGFSWRRDIPPILAACLAYQWAFIGVGYGYEKLTGKFPGANLRGDYESALWVSLLGLSGLALGFRLTLALFAKRVRRVTIMPEQNYDVTRLSILIVALFGLNLFYDVLPKQIWFGGAQIIENFLTLRFLPCFVLIYLVGRYGLFWARLWIPLLVVMGVQLLSGFSRFKEILLYIVIIVMSRWRPWVRSRKQSVTNMRITVGVPLGVFLMLWLGVLWSGGVKQEWRDLIWADELEMSPLARLGRFSDIASEAASRPDSEGLDHLIERLSSGFYYLSLTIPRIPRVLPHENGEMTMAAIRNATIPRFLFPDKPEVPNDSLIVRKYAGIWVAGSENKTSIGMGYIGEFYIDFGWIGVFILCVLWGAVGGVMMVVYAMVAPNKEIFFGLCAISLMEYFMSYDGSFIKLFAGLIQQTAVLSGAVYFLGPRFADWSTSDARRTRSLPSGGSR